MKFAPRLALLTFLTVGWLCISTQVQAEEANKPVHLFILSGQSNMAGMNTKLGFEPELKELFPAGNVQFFKVAKGGQPIRLWLKDDWTRIAEQHGLNKPLGNINPKTDYYQQILEKFSQLSKQQEFETTTFCWMQGERDAREGLSAAYQEALETLISNLRRDLKHPNMNFVIGRLSDYQSPNPDHWTAVQKAQVAAAEKDSRGSWVDCDDLNNKSKDQKTWDDLHYTKEGYELLGRRYVRQGKHLIDGTTPAANGRPAALESVKP